MSTNLINRTNRVENLTLKIISKKKKKFDVVERGNPIFVGLKKIENTSAPLLYVYTFQSSFEPELWNRAVYVLVYSGGSY